MVSTSTVVDAGAARVAPETDLAGEETARSAVSWSAIFTGAVAAVAVTLILLMLGTGLGLTMISPWYGRGASAETIGIGAVVWFVIMQWLSSALGGYLTGRLRAKWVWLHTNEVIFRDTAHGFMAWALATVFIAYMVASFTASGIGGAARGATEAAVSAGAGAASQVAQATTQNGGADTGYFVDMLLRSNNPAAETNPRDLGTEVSRILMRSFQDGKVTLAPDDRTYLAQQVAARTGMNQADAESRVDAIVNQLNEAQQKARAAADEARKRTAQVSILSAVAMVIGAFIGAAAAALGGRMRDEPDSGYRTTTATTR
jgi:hypothetical protein